VPRQIFCRSCCWLVRLQRAMQYANTDVQRCAKRHTACGEMHVVEPINFYCRVPALFQSIMLTSFQGFLLS
jgi:hypothetical protein